MPNSIAIAPRDETLGHAIISKSLTEPMKQNNRRFWMQIKVRWWFHAFSTLLSLCAGKPWSSMVHIMARETNADLLCLTLTNESRSGDMPLYEPAMVYFSEVVEIWANQQQHSIGWYDGLAQIRRQAIIWINNGNFTCTHVNWNLTNKLQWELMRNSQIFIQENAFENVVCEMTAISSRPQCVKISFYGWSLWWAINCSSNGFAPKRRQAITWSNYVLFYSVSWDANMCHWSGGLFQVMVYGLLGTKPLPEIKSYLHQ